VDRELILDTHIASIQHLLPSDVITDIDVFADDLMTAEVLQIPTPDDHRSLGRHDR
jgi:hypothetical protein